ncbi:MAG: hypothetical protein ACLFTZ_00910, partial [Acholeplasmataceae bacterium]
QNVPEGLDMVVTPLQKRYVTNDINLADDPNYIHTYDSFESDATVIFEEYDADGVRLGIYTFTYSMDDQ